MRIYLPYLFIVAFLFLLFPSFFYLIPGEGLDVSYNIAIFLAYKYNLVFGKDFVFTFGPLGILNDRFPISVSRWVYLLFDVHFLGTLFFILKDIFKKHFSYPLVIFVFLSITVALRDAMFQRYFYCFLFYLFALIKEPRKMINIVQAALLSILCFYYKLNLGITAIVLFWMAISYTLIRKKMGGKVYAGVAGSYILLLLSAAWLLHVNLKGYIIGGLQLIDGYNDAMSLPAGGAYVIFLCEAVLIVAIIAGRGLYLLTTSIRKKELLKNADELFIHGITALAIFVLYKSGFVRADGSHMFYFFKISTLLAGFLFLYNPPGFNPKTAARCCWSVLAIATLAAITIPGNGDLYLRNLGGLPARIKEIGNYCREIKNYPTALMADPGLTDTSLRSIVGSHTVDIIPTEVSTLYFNGLHYHPRPVIQSYSAYNAYLDSLNYQKYISPDAPDYILFSLSSIDGRLPFFDESRTKLAILSHYTLAGAVKGNLLLRKKAIPENLLVAKEDGWVDGRIGEDMPVDNHYDLQYSKIFVRYSIWGRIRRLFYQPPSLTMTLTLEDGEKMTYRAIPTLLEDGMILNKYIELPEEFQLLMQSGGRWCTNIKKIRLDQDPGAGLSGFVPAIKMKNTYYTFPEKPEAERRADSLGVAGIIGEFNKYKPALVDPSLYEPDSFPCWIESGKTYSPLMRLSGWAYRERSGNENSVAGVVLRSDDKVYELPSEKQNRRDVALYYKRKSMALPGFTARVSKSQLPPGTYQLGITLYDSIAGKRWIHYTDNKILLH